VSNIWPLTRQIATLGPMSAADHFLTHTTVAVDSREKTPYDFGPAVQTTVKGLPTGVVLLQLAASTFETRIPILIIKILVPEAARRTPFRTWLP
jgi:hypothetical protein